MFKLVIQDDEGKTTVVPLIRDEITIGRKEGNTIRLTERNVSRKHAKISRAGGGVAIEDLGSYNGVRVNGTRISQRTVLTVSDRVQIGDYLIELKAEIAEQPPAPYEDVRTQPIERYDAPSRAPVASPVSLAETDPGSRVISADALAGAAAASAARVVVLSSNFAGAEFALVKPEMVIGRTDENDIVINHRSISRNHARIVREPDTDRFTIMDLQSSNGVRVNGEDYGKVELRRGDVIDLGHVRLRFVEPGEDFVFGRDAQIADVPIPGKRGWMYGALGFAVVGGIVVVAMNASGRKASPPAGDSAPPAIAAAAVPEADATIAAAPANPPAEPPVAAVDAGAVAIAPPPSVPDGAAEVASGLASARAAMESGRWADASSAAGAVLARDPGNAEARAVGESAKRELKIEAEYARFVEAAGKKQYELASTLVAKIPGDSAYHAKARDTFEQLRGEFVAVKTQEAKDLAKGNKCKDLRRLATDAGRVFPEARAAVAGVECEEATVAVAKAPSPPRPPAPSADKPVEPGRSSAELTAEAQTAAKASQWGKALSFAEQSLRAGPDEATKLTALTIAGISACNLANRAKAKEYYGKLKLSVSRQNWIRQRCLANDVNLD